ncbi:hypothetical protein ACEQPO_08940 [Bacillus sp. SL00103]
MCVSLDPDRDEIADMEGFLQEAMKKVKAPFVIDSTDKHVIEKALTYSQGKPSLIPLTLKMAKNALKKFFLL